MKGQVATLIFAQPIAAEKTWEQERASDDDDPKPKQKSYEGTRLWSENPPSPAGAYVAWPWPIPSIADAA
jgi:hypothetical protein